MIIILFQMPTESPTQLLLAKSVPRCRVNTLFGSGNITSPNFNHLSFATCYSLGAVVVHVIIYQTQ
jgi:hypothetical protein